MNVNVAPGQTIERKKDMTIAQIIHCLSQFARDNEGAHSVALRFASKKTMETMQALDDLQQREPSAEMRTALNLFEIAELTEKLKTKRTEADRIESDIERLERMKEIGAQKK